MTKRLLPIDLKGKLVLILGNGPSSWWLTPTLVDRARERWSRLVVAACNRTAILLGTEYGFALDRAAIEEMLDVGYYHSHVAVVNGEVLHSVLKERGVPPGLHVGENVLRVPPQFCSTGSGVAMVKTLAGCGLQRWIVLGFDGTADPRTRWQGHAGYRKRPTNGALLEEWVNLVSTTLNGVIREVHDKRRGLIQPELDREWIAANAWVQGALSCPS